MKRFLVVVDLNKDFVNGKLGTREAQAIAPYVARKVSEAMANGTTVIFTMDTHGKNYTNTQEGKNLPVEHCIYDETGWMLDDEIFSLFTEAEKKDLERNKKLMSDIFDKFDKGIDTYSVLGSADTNIAKKAVVFKSTFGSMSLFEIVRHLYTERWMEDYRNMLCHSREITADDMEIEIIGLCTDICVISNAILLKTCFPEVKITVDSKGCAGVTPEKHLAALEVMRSCQINVI